MKLIQRAGFAIASIFMSALCAFACAAAADDDAMTPPPAIDSVHQESEPKTEIDLPVDSRIRLRIEPLMPGQVVDRVCDDVTVTVWGVSMQSARLMLVPVDAPYGGMAIGKPRILAKSDQLTNRVKLFWNGRADGRYFKIFAVVRRTDSAGEFRSPMVDIAVSSARQTSVQP